MVKRGWYPGRFLLVLEFVYDVGSGRLTGLGHLVLNQENAGSNPVRCSKNLMQRSSSGSGHQIFTLVDMGSNPIRCSKI